jgi:hypothetical protein
MILLSKCETAIDIPIGEAYRVLRSQGPGGCITSGTASMRIFVIRSSGANLLPLRRPMDAHVDYETEKTRR